MSEIDPIPPPQTPEGPTGFGEADAAGPAPPPQASSRPPETRPEKLKRWAWETATTLFIVLIVFATVKTFLADVYLVRGDSMETTFHDGEKVVISKLTPWLFDLERGDVVVFSWPGDDRRVIKRIVGLPGDLVERRDGLLYVNDERMTDVRSTREDTQIRVKSGFYYLLGDNRVNSRDSRVKGPLSVSDIDGKVVLVLWPPGSIRLE